MSKTGWLAAGLALTILGALALSGWWRDEGTALARVRQQGAIRIGYAVEPPYAFLDADGRVTGESPEVARRVVAMLGLPSIEWRQMEFRDLIPALESGRIDVVAAGLFATDERARRVRFSRTTFQVAPAMLVRQADAECAAVLSGAAGIAVLAGAVEGDVLRRMGVPETVLVTVPDVPTGRAAVLAGNVDALVLSAPTVRWLASKAAPGLTAMRHLPAGLGAVPPDYGRGGFAFNLGDRDLALAWDRILAMYVGSAEHHVLLTEFGFGGTGQDGRQEAMP